VSLQKNIFNIQRSVSKR